MSLRCEKYVTTSAGNVRRCRGLATVGGKYCHRHAVLNIAERFAKGWQHPMTFRFSERVFDEAVAYAREHATELKSGYWWVGM